jgi:prophage antirepressor-like protein
MDIVKAFNSNELHAEIIIKGTYDSPLFRAGDIGVVLEMGNIRTTIQHFDDTEKVVHIMDTLGGSQAVTFLTEKGLYKVLFKSRKPIADKFQNWICEVIKEIRLTGKYELKQQLEEAKQQIEQKDNIIIEIQDTAEQEKKQILQKNKQAVEQAIIAQFPKNTECVYFGTIDNVDQSEKLIKFGQTNDLQTRVYNHHGKFNNFILTNAFKVQNKVEIENLIKCHPKIKKQLRQITLGDKVYKEIIAYDETKFTIDNLSYYIKEIIRSKQYSIDNFNALMKRNEDLELELSAALVKIDELVTTNSTNTITMNEMKITIDDQQKQLLLLSEEHQGPIIEKDEQTQRFDEFISSCCIIHKDFEESTVNMEGQFRIWNKVKPKKETFHLFKQYLDTRFRPKRLQKQDKNQIVHGYAGVKLNTIEYTRVRDASCDVETFIFNVCRFSPCGKIQNSTLLDEYQRWKKKLNKVNKEISSNNMKEIKEYLNSCAYVQKGTVWVNTLSNEGYYGLSLRQDDVYQHKLTSSTGKKVQKICRKTNLVVNSWDTIIKAAIHENMSPVKMSRSIKNKTIYEEFYYI